MRSKAGKISVSQEKLELVVRNVVFHLGKMKSAFTIGALKDGYTINGKEKNFVINTHEDCMLATRGKHRRNTWIS